ncbi:MAG: efflux RND transporter periplasmic adaptor subunit [Merismopedia sp. SIO2A8]|nr:efflux RND transporter periplasmic adaptor subunit [Symploca sp. SIO2B6]NET52269.1 efflux RND transporter periplasmic adaptor subunit [Merismopedia sp. SIO2A8]
MLGKVKTPTPWIIGLVAAGLLGTVATAYLVLRSSTPNSDITDKIVVVAAQNLPVQIKGNGVVQAVRKITLSPKLSGKIDQLYVDEGDWVEPGKLIARMDSEQFQAQVNQYQALVNKAKADLAQKLAGSRPEEIAEARARVIAAVARVNEVQARLERAKEELQRQQLLAQAGAISSNALGEYLTKQKEAAAILDSVTAQLKEREESLRLLRKGTREEEIAQAEAAVAQAKAQLQYYETQLDNTLIRAPFAGIITRRFAQEGDFVTPTTSASSNVGAISTSIAELSSGLEVEAKVPEASIASIKPQQEVKIRTSAYPEEEFAGKVRLIAPRAVQENNVTLFRVKVALETGKDKLKSGMNVNLTFIGEEIEKALVVPLAAVVTKNNGQTGVLMPDHKNKAQFQPVTIGATSGTQTQILEGVSEGERIFIEPPADQKIKGVDTLAF